MSIKQILVEKTPNESMSEFVNRVTTEANNAVTNLHSTDNPPRDYRIPRENTNIINISYPSTDMAIIAYQESTQRKIGYRLQSR